MRWKPKRRLPRLIIPVVLAVGLLGYWRWREWRDHSQDEVILAAAEHYGVDPALVKAVVWRESGFDPAARGAAGEIGLMQVGKLAAQEWAGAEGLRLFFHWQLFEPAKNTLAGTWYLQKLLSRYQRTDNPVAYALADYNAGRANVLRWMKGEAATNSAVFVTQMDFPSTRAYVQSVQAQYGYYRQLFPRPDQKEPRMDTNGDGEGPVGTNSTY